MIQTGYLQTSRKNAQAEAHTKTTIRKDIDGSGFELCPPGGHKHMEQDTHKMSTIAAGGKISANLTHTGLDGPCDLGDHMEIQATKATKVSRACCPWDKFCSGCADFGSKCRKCLGGFYMKNKSSGVCTSCLDTPWKNATGHRCEQIATQSCNDDIWQGLSSNRACCVCGGGHRSAHPWRYWVGPQAVGVDNIDIHPMPRTANWLVFLTNMMGTLIVL
jgi:hypothetical protein